MMLHGIGFVGSKIKFQYAHGDSFDAGFYLELTMHDKTLFFKTSGLDQDEIDKRNREKTGFKIFEVVIVAVILCFVYLGVVFSMRTAVLEPWTSLASTFLATPAAMLLVSVFLPRLTSNQKEWHACEHKSLALLKSGLEPTVSNLNRCHASLIFCGFAQNSIQFVFLISMWTLGITGFEIVSWPSAVKLASIFYLLDSFILTVFINLAMPEIQSDENPQKNPFFWLFYVASLPTILPIIVLEKMLVLKTPSPDKLEETALVLREFVQNNRVYKI